MRASKMWLPRGARGRREEHVPASYTTACAYPGAISLTLLRNDERATLTVALERSEAEDLAYSLIDAARTHEVMEGASSGCRRGMTYRLRAREGGPPEYEVLPGHGADPVIVASSERDARRLCDPVVLDLVDALRVLSQDPRIAGWLLDNDPLALTHARTVLRRAGIKEG